MMILNPSPRHRQAGAKKRRDVLDLCDGLRVGRDDHGEAVGVGIAGAQLVQAGQDPGIAVAQAAIHPAIGAASTGDMVVAVVAELEVLQEIAHIREVGPFQG